MYQRICFGAANHLYNYSEFICDTEADIADLPTFKKKMSDGSNCCAGSQALVLDTQKKYVLNNQDEWIEIANVADEVDALAALSECGIITPAYQDGTFYTNADGAIYVL